jgi:hypothetical protein
MKAVEALVFDKVDINKHRILVTDSKTHLNVVCGVNSKGNDLEISVVTVMRKEDFRNDKAGTYRIYV